VTGRRTGAQNKVPRRGLACQSAYLRDLGPFCATGKKSAKKCAKKAGAQAGCLAVTRRVARAARFV